MHSMTYGMAKERLPRFVGSCRRSTVATFKPFVITRSPGLL